MSYEQWDNDEELKYFREYLRIPTVHPDPNYGGLYIYFFQIPYLKFIKMHRARCGFPKASG